VGSVPAIELLDKSRTVRPVKSPISVGSVPFKLVEFKTNLTSFVNSPISVGKLELQGLSNTNSVVSQVYDFPHTEIEFVQFTVVGLIVG